MEMADETQRAYPFCSVGAMGSWLITHATASVELQVHDFQTLEAVNLWL